MNSQEIQLVPEGRQESFLVWTAIVAAGLLAAVLIPFTRAGINIAATGPVAVVVTLLATRAARTKTKVMLLVGAALLFIPFALFDAEWLLALDLMVAFGLIGLASVDASRIWQIITLPVQFLRATPLTPRIVIQPAMEMFASKIAAARLTNVVKTVALALPLLLIFGALFASADSSFAELLRDFLPEIRLDRLFVRTVLFVFVVLAISYASVAGEVKEIELGKPWFGATEWQVTLVLLDILFTTFIALQVNVLFGGHSVVQQTDGLTYAEHARTGFFQLIAASALTLLVLAAAGRHYRQSSEVRALSGLLCGLTLVVLASALARLQLYEDVFGFTSSRMFAHAVILWLGALFVTVIALAAAKREGWILRAAFAVTIVSLIIFNVINPDRKVAQLNVDRYEATGRFDPTYCYEISADSVPELLRLPKELRPYVRVWAQNHLGSSDPLPGWNLSRENAREVLRASAPNDATGSPTRHPIDESC